MANEANLRPFKKGYDPRRGHKPKGTRHLSTIIQELMNDESFVGNRLQGRRKKKFQGAPAEAIVITMMHAAMLGDVRAAEWLAKNGWGKVSPPGPEVSPNPIHFVCNVPIGIRSDEDKGEYAL